MISPEIANCKDKVQKRFTSLARSLLELGVTDSPNIECKRLSPGRLSVNFTSERIIENDHFNIQLSLEFSERAGSRYVVLSGTIHHSGPDELNRYCDFEVCPELESGSGLMPVRFFNEYSLINPLRYRRKERSIIRPRTVWQLDEVRLFEEYKYDRNAYSEDLEIIKEQVEYRFSRLIKNCEFLQKVLGME